MIDSRRYIDNSQTIYIPIRLQCGVTIQCVPEVLHQCPSVIQTLESDAAECLRILPPAVHGLIRRIQIWVNVRYCYGAIDDPKILKHTTAHHYRQWLEAVNDSPRKALGVEIYSGQEYERSRLHWNGCGLLLHELSHLVHQVVLDNGLNNEMVIESFGRALESGLYDNVLRRDWAFLPDDEEWDAAYATINHKEFFAEQSVAFLSRGYEGCVSNGATTSNAMTIEETSPPIMALDVIRRMEEGGHSVRAGKISGNVFSEIARRITTGSPGRGHCNKFFPFTHGQLKEFDPDTYQVFQHIWGIIACWEDPADVQMNKMSCKGCITQPLFCGIKRGTKKETSYIVAPSILLKPSASFNESLTGTSVCESSVDTTTDQEGFSEDAITVNFD